MPALPPPDPTTMVHDRFAAPLGGRGIAAVDVDGSPTAEEVVAVMAAIEHLWPKPALVLPNETVRTTPPWRFSGRWWARPVAARRARPWY